MKLIVEMEMPRNCDECEVNYDCAFCGITGSAFYGNTQIPNFVPDEQKLPNCPIVGVLPEEHGDLIDRDEVKKEILKRMPKWCLTGDADGSQFCSRREMLYPISRAKAVIAAERKDDGTTAD